ncbi:calcium-binding protein [Leisingera sp. ANG-M6]|uniref:calcium-binding protein n=1 Tax=Leisingera sp. ANG-M6 TaxID=1577900 RepID=UPI001269AE26|nr:calcium-binding protein [Leisingera sp. ANG-M6]
MATFTVNDSSYNWSVGALKDYRIYNYSAGTVTSSVVVVNGSTYSGQSVTVTYTGSFSAAGGTVFGTLTGVSVKINGSTAMSASGMNASFYTYSNGTTSSFVDDATEGNDLFNITSTRTSTWQLGDGNDTINSGNGNEYIYGGDGIDRLIVDGKLSAASFSSSYGRMILDGSDGRDYLSSVELVQFSDRTVSVKVGSSSSNKINGDRFSRTPDDILLGGNGNDTISGRTGNDSLIGESGTDVLYGQSGHDKLYGGAGGDRLHGGEGNDTLKGGDSASETGDDKLYGERGNDRLEGQAGNDSLFGGKNHDTIFGGAGNDVLYGETGHDTLQGGTGNDTLRANGGDDYLSGGSGNDLIEGGVGNDTLYGRSGSDTLRGQAGDDQLHGGTGADVFIFHRGYGNDTIQDFTAGQDHIKIGVGANGMGDLEFQTRGDDVLVSFSNVTILVEDITLAQLQDADNFLF